MLVMITVLTTLTTTIAVFAGGDEVCVDDQLCHSFRPNNDPAASEQPLDDTTTAMQPIDENNTDTVQPSKDIMETKMLMEKNIVH